METRRTREALILGALLCIGLLGGAWLAGEAALRFKQLERTVTVKGLAEREVTADIAIWPVRFSEVGNDLATLNAQLEKAGEQIVAFLKEKGFKDEEITLSAPTVIDKQAQGYGEVSRQPFRYTASNVITVYTSDVERVREARLALVELGKRGVAITGEEYQTRVEYLYTGLNDIKPAMIEEATRNAREVAEKFARDSSSSLGRIRRANQGQFSIEDRDSNTPHIKKVRVVSTLEYYLTD